MSRFYVGHVRARLTRFMNNCALASSLLSPDQPFFAQGFDPNLSLNPELRQPCREWASRLRRLPLVS